VRNDRRSWRVRRLVRAARSVPSDNGVKVALHSTDSRSWKALPRSVSAVPSALRDLEPVSVWWHVGELAINWECLLRYGDHRVITVRVILALRDAADAVFSPEQNRFSILKLSLPSRLLKSTYMALCWTRFGCSAVSISFSTQRQARHAHVDHSPERPTPELRRSGTVADTFGSNRVGMLLT
jgi:hypothetical protein